jgi:arginase
VSSLSCSAETARSCSARCWRCGGEGRYGLLYIDGDADFYQPQASPLRGAASASDLAFATGYGPDVVTDIEGRRPLVRADDVVLFACRDAADRERRACQPLPAGMLVIDRARVRRLGAGAAAREAVRYLTRDGGPEDGFWVHLDADVLDETIMQAVDDPRPDGLAWDELLSALSIAIRSGRAAGLQVAIYNPDIDADGSNGRGLAATLLPAHGITEARRFSDGPNAHIAQLCIAARHARPAAVASTGWAAAPGRPAVPS